LNGWFFGDLAATPFTGCLGTREERIGCFTSTCSPAAAYRRNGAGSRHIPSVAL